MKKNCNNCKHLVYDEEAEYGYMINCGYTCEKRYDVAEYNGTSIQLENNLQRKEYREKGKVCFEARSK